MIYFHAHQIFSINKLMISAYRILLFSIFISTSLNMHAQQPADILHTAETSFPQEKIYLHTDKPAYNAGETIWFKAYLAADNSQTPLSQTLYAELIDEKSMVLQRKVMPVFLAGAGSDFILPDSLTDSRLFIRAYTAWMLNFDSTLLCIKPLYIVPKKNSAKKTAAASSFSISFFPEGGDLIETIASTVAFKASTKDGTPFHVKGDIVNSKNEKITSFAAVHDGMGSFLLEPAAGETYKAVWKDRNGVKQETALPAVKKEGAAISCIAINNQLDYTLTRSENAGDAFTRFTIVAQCQQRHMYSAQINLSRKKTVTAPIVLDSIPDGVLQITVFNALMVPVAERLVYVNNNNYSFITDLHLVEKNIVKHGRNVLQIDAGGTLLTNLSIAVTDADINPPAKNEENIFSGFLLTSDLKGYVYNPAYYFSSEEDSVKQHLDLVMMTNGWRRFKWEKMMAGEWPLVKYQPEKYLTIEGKVIGLTKTLLYNKEVTGILKTKNNPPMFLNFPLSDKGDFSMNALYFFDTATMYYQLSNDKDKNLTTAASFSFKNSFINAPLLNREWAGNIKLPEMQDSLALAKSSSLAAQQRLQQSSLSKIKTLQEATVIVKRKPTSQKLDEQYTSGFFSGGDGYTFAVEDDALARSSPGILEYLQGRVAGLQINASSGSATWRGSQPSFFVNEINSDVNQLRSINMADVALIKVFRPPFFGAMGGGAGGAIAVYTKKGGGDNSSFKGLPAAKVYGYSAIREFYAPDYSNAADPAEKDYRSTLYWNPHIYFDKNNRRFTIPFFNSDNCKKIRVIIEGVNENGIYTREEKIF